MSSKQSVGWEMTLVKQDGTREEWHCLARNEHEARRKGMLKPRVWAVEELRSVPRESYVAAYGDPRIRT